MRKEVSWKGGGKQTGGRGVDKSKEKVGRSLEKDGKRERHEEYRINVRTSFISGIGGGKGGERKGEIKQRW